MDVIREEELKSEVLKRLNKFQTLDQLFGQLIRNSLKKRFWYVAPLNLRLLLLEDAQLDQWEKSYSVLLEDQRALKSFQKKTNNGAISDVYNLLAEYRAYRWLRTQGFVGLEFLDEKDYYPLASPDIRGSTGGLDCLVEVKNLRSPNPTGDYFLDAAESFRLFHKLQNIAFDLEVDEEWEKVEIPKHAAREDFLDWMNAVLEETWKRSNGPVECNALLDLSKECKADSTKLSILCERTDRGFCSFHAGLGRNIDLGEMNEVVIRTARQFLEGVFQSLRQIHAFGEVHCSATTGYHAYSIIAWENESSGWALFFEKESRRLLSQIADSLSIIRQNVKVVYLNAVEVR